MLVKDMHQGYEYHGMRSEKLGETRGNDSNRLRTLPGGCYTLGYPRSIDAGDVERPSC